MNPNIQTQEFDPHTAIRKLADAELADGIVPFAALRIECSTGDSMVCSMCHDRGWVPEPDVRVACWEILKVPQQKHVLWSLTHNEDGWMVLKNEPGDYDDCDYVVEIPSATAEEALIRAALVWLEEQGHDVTT